MQGQYRSLKIIVNHLNKIRVKVIQLELHRQTGNKLQKRWLGL